jgi:CheY-like chemotaxis protein
MHGGAFLSTQPSVLIVDESAENREVLKLALQRRGTQIFEANRLRDGLEMMRQHQPDVIVMDAEASAAEKAALSTDLGQSVQIGHIPVVVLGTAPRQSGTLPNEEFVAKPYHYRPLIRKIEDLLEQAASCYVR